ncbi:MAG: FIST N-terminal domain-containing protein [Bdellovibrionales bacterium]
MKPKSVCRAKTNLKNPEEAVSFLAKELKSKDAKMSILFISDAYDVKSIEPHIKEYMGENVVACSTAGEINSEEGYCENSISGVSLNGDAFEVSVLDIPVLDNFKGEEVSGLRKETLSLIDKHREAVPKGRSFAFLLIDGLAMKEEEISNSLAHVIPGGVPLVGGSAGDGLNFKNTYIYNNGKFEINRAIVVLATTSLPFEVFKFQHFSESETQMVITEADPKNRLVKEIDGEPAAEAYARFLNVPISEFGPEVYSKHPVMLNIGGSNYVRSIQKVNEDNSLTFYCAIEEGIVLTLANKDSVADNVESLFTEMKSKLGELDSCVLFECILRRLEILSINEADKERIMKCYKENNAMGFHTYGEQFGGIHVNQTITGIAFGHE